MREGQQGCQQHLLAIVQSWHFRPHCVNARRSSLSGSPKDLNSFPFGELEETTRTSSYYVDEDHPARPEITSPWLRQSTWLRIIHSGD